MKIEHPALDMLEWFFYALIAFGIGWVIFHLLAFALPLILVLWSKAKTNDDVMYGVIIGAVVALITAVRAFERHTK